MAINYNSLKSLKGTSIGTIVAWSGDIATIPKGWIRCDGTEKQVSDYPLLYQILGTRYGGTANVSFVLPSVAGKGLVDYHTSHQNISGIGMSDTFKNLINNTNDVANSISPSPSSNIDLRVNQTAFNNIKANVVGQALNDPAYFDSVYVAGRLLGDDHIGQHSHDGTFTNVSNPSSWVESCQQNGFDNCFNIFGGCPDQCGTITGYEVEYNTSGRQDLFKATPQGGISFYWSQQASAAVDFAQSNSFGNSGFRNYILASEDPQSSNTGSYPYNVTLDQNAVQWINNGNYHQPHDHQSSSYSITKGTMTIPTTYSINNLGTGNIAPVNAPQQGIGTIQIETDTPVCQVMYIIRAY